MLQAPTIKTEFGDSTRAREAVVFLKHVCFPSIRLKHSFIRQPPISVRINILISGLLHETSYSHKHQRNATTTTSLLPNCLG
ncbi:unnamed protein product [Clavelina lepadiformis]|uniref:Uncharacterized protein n=1 Tax=Clavelina lepadiformis TaxID=159417 RepID=A0ABP0GM83_CLALP